MWTKWNKAMGHIQPTGDLIVLGKSFKNVLWWVGDGGVGGWILSEWVCDGSTGTGWIVQRNVAMFILDISWNRVICLLSFSLFLKKHLGIACQILCYRTNTIVTIVSFQTLSGCFSMLFLLLVLEGLRLQDSLTPKINLWQENWD